MALVEQKENQSGNDDFRDVTLIQKEALARVRQLERDFRMPAATLNQEINWYHLADPTNEPKPALVRFLGTLAIDVTVRHGIWEEIDSVRHISDPALISNPNLRDAGGWDFTDEYKERMNTAAEIRDRLSTIESRLDSIESGPANKGAKPKPN